MVSAQLVFRTRRTRPSVSGLSRLLWPALLLLFGVLYTHGISGESAVSHATGRPVALSAFAHAVDEHHAHGEPAPVAAPGTEQVHAADHHEDESSHGAENCTSGKPQDGPALFAPSCSALFDALSALSSQPWTGGRPSPAALKAAHSAASRVLRI
ncbi:hypothetical protein ABZ752_16880 [Streptomyces roseifaciens]